MIKPYRNNWARERIAALRAPEVEMPFVQAPYDQESCTKPDRLKLLTSKYYIYSTYIKLGIPKNKFDKNKYCRNMKKV